MKKVSSRTNLANRSIPAIVAVGSSLAALPAAALELGELTVQSRLGQPLRASIAYALAPNEQLSNYCVTMRPGPSVSGLPGFGPATVSLSNGVILLTGNTPVREPMVSAHVIVNCPYSANLSREYLLFIDPLSPAYDQAAVTQQLTPAAESVVAVAPAAIQRPVASVKARPVNKDIAPSTRYQVQPGNTLSDIAARIQNRPIGLWPAVNAIFAANPDAFINDDPNQLKAGSWLSIPSFDGSASIVAAVDTAAEPVADLSESVDSVSAAYQPEATVEVAPIEEPTAVVVQEAATIEKPAIADEPVVDMTSDLRPGDIILDTELEGPITASASPNVPTAIITNKSSGTDGAASPSWFIWLAGGGIALIFGLLMFGRRLGNRTGTAPAPTAAPTADQAYARRFSDTHTTDTENVEALGVDYDLTDDSPTEENLALDADLVIGTGLEHATSSGDSDGFSFAEVSKLDIELPFEPVASMSEETDMLLPLTTDESSILESEVMPENDEYDMSVIVDATKMPRPEDVTERDLKAVEVATEDETLISQKYTISEEVDFEIIEQDYEDEMTATQVLNGEIAKAAAELTESMEVTLDDSGEQTTALPLATVTELDITAQMPAQNDEISDLEDTGINEAITVNTVADDETVEMPAKSEKAN